MIIIKKNIIYDYLKKLCEENDFNLSDGDYEKFTSSSIANFLKIKRNVVSQALNALWNTDVVIKINTRPVYFFSKEVIEKKLKAAINKNEFRNLNEFFSFLANPQNTKTDPFSKMIGYNYTISHEIEQCKVAVNYPPVGLPVLIHGATGVGKSFLAQLMYEYAKERNLIDGASSFITVNCSEFADNPELITANLFGYTKGSFTGADEDKAGFIEEADGGFLFLDEVHRLSAEGQEKLFLFMDKGVYRRLGETSGWRKSKVRLIFATTEELNEVLLSTFLRRIPIIINLPSLEERSPQEKIDLICHFFLEESKNIEEKLTINKRVLNTLANQKYEANIGELRNIIKHTCANAYFKKTSDNGNTDEIKKLYINMSHLPDEFIKKIDTKSQKYILHETQFNDINIEQNGKNKENEIIVTQNPVLEELFTNIMTIISNYSKDILDSKEFIFDINKVIDKFFDDLTEKINFDSYKKNVRLSYIKITLEDLIKLVNNNYGIEFYANTPYNLAKYIYYKSKNSYNCSRDLSKKINECSEEIKKLYTKEYEIASMLAGLINDNLGIELYVEDLIIFTLYIKGTNRNQDIDRIRAVIIAHGHSTASSIANVVNRLLGQYVFEPFDMPFDMPTEQVIEHLINSTNYTDTDKGMILLVDMGSLENIYVNLDGFVSGTIGIISNFSTTLAIDVGSKILEGMDAEKIVKNVTERSRPKYKIIKNTSIKKKAILTTCITGIGTANKIKDMLTESLGKNIENIEILPYDFIKLKNNGKTDSVFKQYQVIGIIGTSNSMIDNIPFISLEDIILENKKDVMRDIFEEIATKEELASINKKIIKLFSLQSVISHLTILNPGELMNKIENVIDDMQLKLKVSFSNKTRISLFVHISCLIERLVKNTPISSYGDMEQFKKCQESFINIVKNSFSVIENLYSVTIPISEIGYIYDIINL